MVQFKQELLANGWHVTDEYLEELATSCKSARDCIEKLLNNDMKEYGEGFLRAGGKLDNLQGPKVFQISKVVNVSAPKEDQENRGAPTLFRIVLTDGKSNLSAMDLDSSCGINLKTAPGTKCCLSGNAAMQSGFLLLSKNCLRLLGGVVEHMYDAWRMKSSVAKHNRKMFGKDCPPPFLPFGSKFQLPVSGQPVGEFKAMAVVGSTAAGDAAAQANTESEFKDRRVAALAQIDPSSTSSVKPTNPTATTSTSKFAQHQREREMEQDFALQQLMDMGVGLKQAKQVLKENQWNVQKAVDSMMSLSADGVSLASTRGSRGRGGRRGGNRGRGGGGGPMDSDEDDYTIDTGPVSKPRTHMTIADFLPTDHPLANEAAAPTRTAPTSARSQAPATVNYLLQMQSSCLAECMDSSFAPATVVDIDSRNRLISVYYHNADEVQQLNLESIRTVTNRKIDASQVNWPPVSSHYEHSNQQHSDSSYHYRGRGGGRRGNMSGRSGRPRGGRRGRW